MATSWYLLYGSDAAELSSPVGRAIAVLPFDNLSPDSENAYFAAGIHEDILSQLAKIADLTVISLTSRQHYADTDKPIPEIADELGVDAILEGSVRRAGHEVRVVTNREQYLRDPGPVTERQCPGRESQLVRCARSEGQIRFRKLGAENARGGTRS